MNFLKNKRLWAFIGGVATTLVASKAAKSKLVHDTTVSAMASAINLKKDMTAKYESMKEDAQDLAHEARMEAERKQAAVLQVEAETEETEA